MNELVKRTHEHNQSTTNRLLGEDALDVAIIAPNEKPGITLTVRANPMTMESLRYKRLHKPEAINQHDIRLANSGRRARRFKREREQM